MGSVDIVLPSRDSARIAKTYVLTMQRYEVILKVPNILGIFLLQYDFSCKVEKSHEPLD